MSKSKVIESYSQIQTINSTGYVELDKEPIVRSIWFIFDEINNIVLFDYQLYTGYQYTDKKDVDVVYIVDKIPSNKKKYVNYIKYDKAEKYLDSLLNKICFNYKTNEYQMVTSDMILKENRKTTMNNFSRNLIGKFFIDWSSSEQIKEMIADGKSDSFQINYWFERN